MGFTRCNNRTISLRTQSKSSFISTSTVILTLTFTTITTTMLLFPQVASSSNNLNDGTKSNDIRYKSDGAFDKLHIGPRHGNVLDNSFQSSAAASRFKPRHQQQQNELNSVPPASNLAIADNDDQDAGYDDEEDEDIAGGGELDDADYDSYEDESGGNTNNWGSDFESNDINEIVNFDKDEHSKHKKPSTRRKPVMAKCCPTGQGLTSEGICKPHHHHHKAGTSAGVGGKHSFIHQTTGVAEHSAWFPQKIFHIERGNWTVPDINDWDIRVGHYITCPENESSELISDTDKFAITNHGKLFVLHRENKEIDGLDFCVDLLLGEGRPAVRSCFTKTELCGSKLQCLRKCCPEDALVQEPSGECVFSAEYKLLSKFPTDKYNVVHGSPSCKFGQYRKDITGQFMIDLNASLVLPNKTIKFDNYCIDYFLESPKFRQMVRGSSSGSGNSLEAGGKGASEVDGGSGYKPVLKVQACFEYSGDQYATQRLRDAGLIAVPQYASILLGVILIISVICLFLAGVISWRLPELHSLHGKCQLCHLGTLFILFLFLAIVHLASEELPPPFCTALALLIHMSALSAFLWLNLLCVNIYLTFRSLRPPLAARRGENRRLAFLCIYAWGIPAAFCTFLYVLETFQPERFNTIPAPEYGQLVCLISNRKAQFSYLYGPVGVLLLCNGILFYLTAKELLFGLWRLDNSDSINFRRKSMGIVVGKLGVVMGMGWLLDVLSWAVTGPQFPYVFYASDIFNALQGVFIFLVLICRKRVLEMLHLRKPSLIKDDTLTGRPFLQNKSSLSTMHTNGGGTPGSGAGAAGGNHVKATTAANTRPDADTSTVLLTQETGN